MDEDSVGVELRGGGWPGVIAHGPRLLTQAPRSVEGVTFQRMDAPALVYSHAAGILVLQGMVLQHFFPPDVYFATDDDRRVTVASGPFILLRGNLSAPWDVPLRLMDVVLAKVLSAPLDMPSEQLRALLLAAVS